MKTQGVPGSAAASPQSPTILALLGKTASFFESRGIPSPRYDAEVLIGHALGLDRLRLYLSYDMPVSEAEMGNIRLLVLKRANRVPLQFILGRAAFMDFEVFVNSDVMVPRPDTETLADAALNWARKERSAGGCAALDLCTGSGIVPIHLARSGAMGLLVAADLSPDALEVARRNVLDLAPARVSLARCDLADGIGGEWDLITSNPPYIPDGEVPELMPEVARYEPRMALCGGIDGLDFYRRLAAEARRLLRPGGGVFVEVGAGQAPEVASMFTAAGLVSVRALRDLTRIERVVAAEGPQKV